MRRATAAVRGSGVVFSWMITFHARWNFIVLCNLKIYVIWKSVFTFYYQPTISLSVISALMAEPRKEYPADINAYHIISEIGKGSSATVYKAECLTYHELVAIKIIDLERVQGPLQDALVFILSFISWRLSLLFLLLFCIERN